MFLFAAKKEPKNRRRFRRGGRTTKGPAGPLESLRLAPGDPVRFGQGNARLAVQAHAPETPVFRPPIENGEQRFPIPLRGRLLQASIRPELPEEGKGLSMLPFMCGHIQCRHAFRCFSFLHSGFLSRLWGCLSFAHSPYKMWKTRCVKAPTTQRKKSLAESHRTGTLPPDSYGTNLSSPRAFPIPGGVKKMMRAADRLPCCALCALRIIFKPPFRFMPRVRCVGVRADQKPGRARSEAEDQRGRVSARTEQRRLFRRFWPVKSGKTAAFEKAQTPPRPAPAGKPGWVKGPRTS